MAVWTVIDPMSVARGFTASACDSTGRIYAIGGIAAGSKLSSAERYDPSAGTWGSITGMSIARSHHGSEADSSGRIYAIGGRLQPTGVTAACERFDPGAGTWGSVASLPYSKDHFGTAVDNSGRIYVIGGTSDTVSFATAGRSLYRFDPAAGTWSSALAVLPTIGRHGIAGASDGSGRIYAIGGFDTLNATVDTVQRFDPAAGTWSTVASLPAARTDASATSDSVGDIYVFGGVPVIVGETVAKYDVGADTWSLVDPLPGYDGMGGGHKYGMGAATDPSDRIFAIGGATQSFGDYDTAAQYGDTVAVPRRWWDGVAGWGGTFDPGET